MATTSGSFNVNTLPHNGTNCFHQDGTVKLYLNYTITRSSEQNSTVDLKINYSSTVNVNVSQGWGYGFNLYAHIHAGNKEGSILVIKADPSGGVNGQPQSGTLQINNITSTSSTLRVTIEGDCTSTIGCNWGSSQTHTWTFSPKVPTYDPYKAPKLTYNSVSPAIGRLDSTTYTANYTVTKGSDTITELDLIILKYQSSWSAMRTIDISNKGSGTRNQTFTLSSSNGFANGSRYYTKMYLNDRTTKIYNPGNSTNPTTGRVIYTYQEPKINKSVSMTDTTTNANTPNKFTLSGINNRAWSSYENEFQTQYRIQRGSSSYTDWTNLGNITSWSRTASEMRSLVPKSYDGQFCTIDFRRYSPSANWYSTNTASASFLLYYRPRMAISESNVVYRQNNSSGTIISKNQLISSSGLSGVYISWVYTESASLAGYVQGYRIRLYNSNSNVVKTYYSTSKNYIIPKSDIPKMQTTYIDITPYYSNDSSDPSDYWYQEGTITKMLFVRVVSALNQPVIQYPVNNSNWINTDFRVCVTLPADPDYGYQDESVYHYEDIELQINSTFTIRLSDSTGHTTSGTNLIATQCFSSLVSDLTYKKPIVIYPKLAEGFPITSSYTLRLRVKKKYYTSGSITGWSSWSNTINISITEPSYNVNEGDLIRASHFNDVVALVNRIRNTYGVEWSTKPQTAREGVTIIVAKDYNYNTLIGKITDTKNVVNNYCVFDANRSNLKFDIDNNIPNQFTSVVGEIITSKSNEDNSPNGRNYIRIVYDKSAYLK